MGQAREWERLRALQSAVDGCHRSLSTAPGSSAEAAYQAAVDGLHRYAFSLGLVSKRDKHGSFYWIG